MSQAVAASRRMFLASFPLAAISPAQASKPLAPSFNSALAAYRSAVEHLAAAGRRDASDEALDIASGTLLQRGLALASTPTTGLRDGPTISDGRMSGSAA